MIKDEAFFGFARCGDNNGFVYPGLIKAGEQGLLEVHEKDIGILGEPVEKTIVYPDSLGYESSGNAFVTDSVAVIPNGIELLQRPVKLIDRIGEIRRQFGFTKLIYVQGISDPYIIPVLVYAGVQIFDDAYPVAEGMSGIRYTIFGKQKSDGDSSKENTAFIEEEMELIRTSIKNGTLREIIEKFAFSSKALEILRILDKDHYGQIEKVYPSRTPYIKANGIESLERPDLRRYREKLLKQYVKPSRADIALVLPCSARKPYSTSRSHQAILSKISGLRKFIHEIIVTSPVGLVPRELEEIYPARFYDIPVIGLWYEEEKKMMKELVREYFARNEYQKVVAFIPEDLEFLSQSFPGNTEIIHGGSSVHGNIDKLRELLKSLSESSKVSRRTDIKLENYLQIASFQFGDWITDYLRNVRIINSYNQDMLVDSGQILLVYNRELGKFTINKKSAEFFAENGKFLVEIDDFKPTSNVYAVGVSDCTADVRPEDEVVLTHKGEVRGVGIAKMPFSAMRELKKGVAVKVRN